MQSPGRHRKASGRHGTLGKLEAKFGNIQEGLERSCNFPSCVIFSTNCSDEICKLFFMVGLFPSRSLFHNAAASFSTPDSRLVLPCLPTQRAIALIKSSSLSLHSLSRSGCPYLKADVGQVGSRLFVFWNSKLSTGVLRVERQT